MITPCVAVCRIEKGLCIGCKRTKEEITYWSQYSSEERLDIMRRLGYGTKRSGREENLRAYYKG